MNGNQRNDSKFVKYKLSEVISKLHSLLREKKLIRLWKKGEVPFLASLIDIESTTFTFTFSCKDIPQYTVASDNIILINFSFNNLDYFLKGCVLEFNEDVIKIIIEQDVFRGERRENERLLTYPHIDAHAYISIGSDQSELIYLDKSNILSFQKIDNSHEDNLKDFLSSKNSEDIPEAWSNEDDEIQMKGFRIMNLSSNGLSFCISLSEEGDYFSNIASDIFDIYILFNGEAYTISGAKIIYSVDYVNPQASVVPMKKIGITYEPLDEFSKVIDEAIGEILMTTYLEKDFENHIDM